MLKRIAAGHVLVCVLLISPCALAEPAGEAKRALGEGVVSKLLEHADANRDGYVGVFELQRFVTKHVLLHVEQRVSRLDRNSDGRVTAVEVPKMPAERFSRFDANGDGAFTVWELAGHMRERALERCRSIFAQLDVDRSGALSLDDVGQQEADERVARSNSTSSASERSDNPSAVRETATAGR